MDFQFRMQETKSTVFQGYDLAQVDSYRLKT